MLVAWKIFFTSAWGRFDHRFSALIDSITKTSELIDKQTMPLNILQAKEWRQKSLEDSIIREQRWESEQLLAVLNWLEAGEHNQELKLEWLGTRCCAGTSFWITRNAKFRSWLQRGRGNSVLWIYGKPGSGQFAKVLEYMSSSSNE